MTEEEKTELLATKLMGWRRPTDAEGSSWASPGGGIPWHDEGGFLIRGWEPFQRIEHAKMVQVAMIEREYGFGVTQYARSDVYDAWFIDESNMDAPLGVINAQAPSEARAICEAAGRALGLWGEE